MAKLDTGGLLGVMTGRLLVSGGMRELNAVAQELAGFPVWTHQLPRVMEELQAKYLPANDFLRDTVETINKMFSYGDINAGLMGASAIMATIGPTMEIEITPLESAREPVAEMRDMMPENAVLIPIITE